MDAAALALNIDSSSVVIAADNLDRFSASAAKAGSASGSQSGSIAKLVATVQSMNTKLGAIVGGLDKVNSALSGMAKASQAAAAANDNVTRAIGMADAHVVAYTQHIAGLARAQQDANAHVLAYQRAVQSAAPPQQQLNAHVEAYRRNLATLPSVINKATASAGALQANTSNIAAQFQDVGVTAFMGMNPLLIGLQQGTQLAGVFAQSGGTMRQVLVGAFQQIASAQAIATIGLVALVAVVIQLGVAWATSGSEADKLADRIADLTTASDGVGTAQSALGNVFDLTTGKMKNQTAAAINLTRAQLLLQQATAQSNISKASRDLDGASSLGFLGRLGAWVKGDRALIEGSARVDLLTKALRNNDITGEQAMEGFKRLADAGAITNEMFLKASTAAANYGMEIENVKTAQQGLADLNRGRLSSQFINATKPRKTPKGPKTDAEKLSDIYRSTNADIAVEKARGLAEANDLTAREAAKLEKQTALLNSVQQKGIPVTDAVRSKVAELAQAYADAKTDADVSKATRAFSDDIARQREAITEQTSLIGLYGDALARATREMEAQRKLKESLPKGEIVVMPNITKGLSDDIEKGARLKRAADLKKASEDSAYAMDLERAGLGLTGAAAIQYAFVVDKLNAYKRAGIDLLPEELAAIQSAGKAYADQRYAIDQAREALEANREIAKGFFTDWVNGARQGASLIKSFGDAVVNALNRVIDKLLDKTLETFLNGMFQNGAGGFLNGLFGQKATAPGLVPGKATVDLSGLNSLTGERPSWAKGSKFDIFNWATGGMFGMAQKFAKGGSFTNQIVSSPTLFRFAKGAKMGQMGEAGPEAIMPLKRGPNGSLGVQMHGGGRPTVQLGDVHLHNSFAGAIGIDSVAEMNRQAAEAAVATVKRQFADIAAEYEQNGVVMP